VARIFGWFDRGLYWLVAVLTAVLATIGFTTVVFRYVLHSSLFWGDEFLRYLQIWLVFLGAALATRHRVLITVDIFTQPLPHRLRESVAATVCGLSSFFLVGLAYLSLELVRRSAGSVSASMAIPMEYMYLVFPIGLGMMAINMIREVIAHAMAAWSGPSPVSGGPASELPDLAAHPE
jgi:TRAP-type C4-dicarboxylate transport system permease small subunit